MEEGGPSSVIPRVPEGVWQHIASFLPVQDVLSLCQTSKALHQVFQSEELWREMCERDFGSVLLLRSILENAGLVLRESRRGRAEATWRQEYRRRRALLQTLDLDALNQKYHGVEEDMERLSERSGDQEIGKIADDLLDILDEFANHIPSYYSLGYLCFLIDQYDEALEFVTIGLEIEPGHSSLLDLKAQVEKKLSEIEGEEDEEPLMEGKALSAKLKQALTIIFLEFDQDKDGAWNHNEIRSFIFATNGVNPPLQVIRQMVMNFPSTPKGYLKIEGLFEFYRRQTLQDPEETRGDLLKHRFNRALKRVDIPPSA